MNFLNDRFVKKKLIIFVVDYWWKFICILIYCHIQCRLERHAHPINK